MVDKIEREQSGHRGRITSGREMLELTENLEPKTPCTTLGSII